MRAYIENKNKFLINNAASHGIETYINQYNLKIEDIEDLETKQDFEVLGLLISNKYQILNYIEKYQIAISNREVTYLPEQNKETITVTEFQTDVEKFKNVVFERLDLKTFSNINCKNVKVSFSLNNLKMEWYKIFYTDILFEIFFNYRKIYFSYIDKDSIFHIHIYNTKKEGVNYLCFKNNLYNYLNKDKPSLIALNNKMLNKKQKSGLGLINTISELATTHKCIIITTRTNFEILIPIEIP